MKQLNGKTLIQNQIDFFASKGITSLYIITPHTAQINEILAEVSGSSINVQIVESNSDGNAQALKVIKSYLQTSNFITMSGDIFIDFQLRNMIKTHIDSKLVATIGLMTRQEATDFGNVVLDGDVIIDFIEKPRNIKSNVVNAGIYIFRPEIFEFFDNSTISLEKDLFPKLAKLHQARGFFVHGEYHHMSSKGK